MEEGEAAEGGDGEKKQKTTENESFSRLSHRNNKNCSLTLPFTLKPTTAVVFLYFCICNAAQYNAVQYNTTCVCVPVPAFLLYKNKQSFEICSLFRIRANIKLLSNF